eukprot:6006308-Prymnesium_polylepis.1
MSRLQPADLSLEVFEWVRTLLVGLIWPGRSAQSQRASHRRPRRRPAQRPQRHRPHDTYTTHEAPDEAVFVRLSVRVSRVLS